MKEKINLIQQVIDQACKAGLFQTIETAAAVNAAWNEILKNIKDNESGVNVYYNSIYFIVNRVLLYNKAPA